MSAYTTPTVSACYSVVCPACYSEVIFTCSSVSQYGIACSTCKTRIDLRHPGTTLAEDDPGCYAAGVTAHYAAEVQPTAGSSAGAQVAVLVKELEVQRAKTMPKVLSTETKQAYTAQYYQSVADKLSFFYPLTYAIEYVVFGTRPIAEIGRVRIFRKWLPFYGHVYLPAPRTTTSYAAPCIYTAASLIGVLWLAGVVDEAWWRPYLRLLYVLVALFYTLLFRLAYTDPGYIRPGYIDDDDARGSDELTLREIDQKTRESVWVDVNGVMMERKWCSTCAMYRPVRAAHCYLCGLCCLDHDHHCTVIGVCVGRRQIELFALFSTVAASACIVPMLLILSTWLNHAHKLTSWQLAASAVLFAPLVFFSVALSLNSFSLIDNIVRERTTREARGRLYANKRNPFSRGPLRNILYHVWQRKVAPSLFDEEFVSKCRQRLSKRDTTKDTDSLV